MSIVQENKSRAKAVVSAYLIFRRGEDVLLQLRQNTGFADGKWALVSGHVEEGESATVAMVREAYEEVGISLQPEALRVIHVRHHRSDRVNMSVFFECTAWNGPIINQEPEKCGGLEFFPLNNLPSNTAGVVADVLHAISRGETYSEGGWSYPEKI
jgi:8-oxo-dGTP diphosphatase